MRKLRPGRTRGDDGIAPEFSHDATYEEKPKGHDDGADDQGWATAPVVEELIVVRLRGFWVDYQNCRDGHDNVEDILN
jgi:hypothetical protein